MCCLPKRNSLSVSGVKCLKCLWTMKYCFILLKNTRSKPWPTTDLPCLMLHKTLDNSFQTQHNSRSVLQNDLLCAALALYIIAYNYTLAHNNRTQLYVDEEFDHYQLIKIWKFSSERIDLLGYTTQILPGGNLVFG